MARKLSSPSTLVGRYPARTLVRQAGVWGHSRRRHRYRPTDQVAAIALNPLARPFCPPAPNQVGAGDVTYLPTQHGWRCSAIAVGRRIVGAVRSAKVDSVLVARALEQPW